MRSPLTTIAYLLFVSQVTMSDPSTVLAGDYTDLRIAIRYRGDSARFNFGTRLLTDNWSV
jgi:hypothetical protein